MLVFELSILLWFDTLTMWHVVSDGDVLLADDVVEGRPAGFGIVLGVGGEQLIATHHTCVHAFVFVTHVFTRKRPVNTHTQRCLSHNSIHYNLTALSKAKYDMISHINRQTLWCANRCTPWSNYLRLQGYFMREKKNWATNSFRLTNILVFMDIPDLQVLTFIHQLH